MEKTEGGMESYQSACEHKAAQDHGGSVLLGTPKSCKLFAATQMGRSLGLFCDGKRRTGVCNHNLSDTHGELSSSSTTNLHPLIAFCP